jgi:hypothetical protein
VMLIYPLNPRAKKFPSLFILFHKGGSKAHTKEKRRDEGGRQEDHIKGNSTGTDPEVQSCGTQPGIRYSNGINCTRN